MHARNSSRDSQAKLIVRSVVKWREFRGNKKNYPQLWLLARLFVNKAENLPKENMPPIFSAIFLLKTYTLITWIIIHSTHYLFSDWPKARPDNPYLELDYSGYHKNLIQWLFITIVSRAYFVGSALPQTKTNARLTQCSKPVKKKKNPVFFRFIRPDFWTDLNGCRQRLLFACHLALRKCSLCSQGIN